MRNSKSAKQSTGMARLAPDDSCATVLQPVEWKLLRRKFEPKSRSCVILKVQNKVPEWNPIHPLFYLPSQIPMATIASVICSPP